MGAELAFQRAQGAEEVRDPGPAGRQEKGLVEHEQSDHRPLPSGRDERGVVVETQVAPEPQDYGSSVGHWVAHRPSASRCAAVTGSPVSRRAPISSTMRCVAPAPARASGATVGEAGELRDDRHEAVGRGGGHDDQFRPRSAGLPDQLLDRACSPRSSRPATRCGSARSRRSAAAGRAARRAGRPRSRVARCRSPHPRARPANRPRITLLAKCSWATVISPRSQRSPSSCRYGNTTSRSVVASVKSDSSRSSTPCAAGSSKSSSAPRNARASWCSSGRPVSSGPSPTLLDCGAERALRRSRSGPPPPPTIPGRGGTACGEPGVRRRRSRAESRPLSALGSAIRSGSPTPAERDR